jgi:hypothetical protein
MDIMAQSPETNTPEQHRSTEEINDALNYAQNAISRLTQDPSFHAACVEADVNPVTGGETADYWHTFRLYVGDRVDDARTKGQDNLRMDAIELTANLPAYLIEQRKLSTGNHHGYDEYRYSKQITSYYNGVIRNFAATYPDTSVAGLRSSLLTSVSQTVHDRGLRESAATSVREMIRGAQHELAFGQILGHTGLPYKEATLEEDLKGVDYTVGVNRHTLDVDVKASLTQINMRGSEGVFAVKDDGKIAIYSMTLDHEFHDRFFTDDETAAAKAPQLLTQLKQAQKVA